MSREWLLLLGLLVLPSSAIFNLDLHRDDANIFKPTRLNLRSTVSEQISQGADHVQYYVNVSIGTPPQPMRLNLDLGASDTVLNIPTSKFCSQASNVCSTYGTYNSNDSSTYDSLNKNFNLTYADGSQLSGNYATDTFHIGNDEVKAFQFGRASSSTIATGVLGIGYAIQEIQVKTNKEQPYPNLPQALANLGLTNSAAYSVWLNDYDSSGGSLLFGGLDKAKYLGELRTIPIVPTTSVDSRFLVSITNIQLGGKTVFDGRNLSAVLDTGTSLTYLPNNVTKQIFDLVGAQYDSTQGAAFVDCAMRENDTTMDITLGWPFINVTMKDLVLDLDVKTKSGAKTCIFGVAPTGDTDFIILGLTALRSAYLVFNLAGNEISIAQSNSNATSSDILEIRNGVDGVPGAIRAPTSIAPAVSTSTSVRPATSSGASSRETPSDDGLSTGAIVGIVIGAIVVLAAIGVLLFFWRKRRAKARQANLPNHTDERDSYVKPELSAESAKAEVVVPPSELHGSSAHKHAELPGSRPPLAELYAP